MKEYSFWSFHCYFLREHLPLALLSVFSVLSLCSDLRVQASLVSAAGDQLSKPERLT
jgi:hypothetical protein